MDIPRSVLVIEDDQFLSSILKTRLQREHIEVTQAFDGEEAVKWITAGNRVGLILLDIIMPKMSGFEVLQAIATNPQYRNTSVLILTNLAQDEDVSKAKELGAKEYFVKVRSSVDELMEHVKRYLPPAPIEAATTPPAPPQEPVPAEPASQEPQPTPLL